MNQLSRDTIPESDCVSDLQVLRERLRTMTVDQVLQELNELTEQAENIGKELDPHIALVYYDIMDELDKLYPQYQFKKHKGYGTKLHLQCLEKYGPLKGIHRFSYKPVKKIIDPIIKLF